MAYRSPSGHKRLLYIAPSAVSRLREHSRDLAHRTDPDLANLLDYETVRCMRVARNAARVLDEGQPTIAVTLLDGPLAGTVAILKPNRMQDASEPLVLIALTTAVGAQRSYDSGRWQLAPGMATLDAALRQLGAAELAAGPPAPAPEVAPRPPAPVAALRASLAPGLARIGPLPSVEIHAPSPGSAEIRLITYRKLSAPTAIVAEQWGPAEAGARLGDLLADPEIVPGSATAWKPIKPRVVVDLGDND